MNSRIRTWLVALVCCCGLVACDQPSTADLEPHVAATPPEAAPPAKSEIPLAIASWDDVQNMVENASGKVVVVDVWSTWCVPCVREFPELVKLHNRMGEEVVCISVNVNYTGSESEPPESFRDSVLAFLEKRDAFFPNVICSDADLELYSKLDVAAVPVVFVYNQKGELAKRFDNDQNEYGDDGFSYEKHVTPLVEQLIAGSVSGN